MRRYERIMQTHPEVKEWLKNRPRNTQKIYAEKLMTFCEAMKITPEKWRRLDKFEARDLAWKYVEPLIAEHSNVARQTMTALKSWYRNLNGEQLPLDSTRGGKHNIRVRRKKATYEKIPNKEEVYRIVDMASSLRDKAILLTLFCTGIRANALRSLTYGIVKDQLQKEIIELRITWDIDQKLRGTNIPFYPTFLNGEAAITLRQYCEAKHKRSKPNTPLFYTRNRSPVSERWLLKIMKMCVERAGFDPKTMWTHSLRKAFRKVVRQSPTDDEFKEMIMGHVLPGSREAYFDRHDVEFFKKEYQKCNFQREIPESEVSKLRAQLEDKTAQMLSLEKRIEILEDFIKKAVKSAS